MKLENGLDDADKNMTSKNGDIKGEIRLDYTHQPTQCEENGDDMNKVY